MDVHHVVSEDPSYLLRDIEQNGRRWMPSHPGLSEKTLVSHARQPCWTTWRAADAKILQMVGRQCPARTFPAGWTNVRALAAHRLKCGHVRKDGRSKPELGEYAEGCRGKWRFQRSVTILVTFRVKTGCASPNPYRTSLNSKVGPHSL